MKLAAIAFVVGACTTESTPRLPASYATTFTEVRNCRRSIDHDLRQIRVLADDNARTPYTDRTSAFPAGAILVKEEYEIGDDTCAGELVGWTVMVRGDTTTNLGWFWQRLDADRAVISENEARCIGCHTTCGQPPDGYAGTCAVP